MSDQRQSSEERLNRPPLSHQDEFPADYSLAGCSPAEPTSASSAMLILNQKSPVGHCFSANGNRPQIPLSQLVTHANTLMFQGRPRLLRLRLLPNLPHFCRMGRMGRVVAVGEVHHITRRSIARQPIFHSDQARSTYLHLLGEQAARFKLRLLGYCLITNHVHWLAVPEHSEALARTVRFVHGPYAQYVNTSTGRNGHFWQKRFYSCPVENSAVGSVLAYIELNPVRAGLCQEAGEFCWSSAGVHLGMPSEQALLDLNWWRCFGEAERWRTMLTETDLCGESLRRATNTGRPFGSEEFVAELEVRLRRKLERRLGGRPKNKVSAALARQQEMFG